MSTTTVTTPHTPGPWHIQFGGLEGDDHFTITSKTSPGAVADYAVAAPRPWREVQANARLIKNAPEMFDVLGEIVAAANTIANGRGSEATRNLKVLAETIEKAKPLLARINGGS